MLSLYGGFSNTIVFFPMKQSSTNVSSINIGEGSGHMNLKYSALTSIQISPKGAAAFSDAIPFVAYGLS